MNADVPGDGERNGKPLDASGASGQDQQRKEMDQMVTQKQDGTVEFTFFGPDARQVAIAGDFNNWQTAAQHLRRDENGWWKLNLNLQPGEYRFKYLIDGALWQTDYAAFGVELDRDSGFRSVLWVRPAASAASVTSTPQAQETLNPTIQVTTPAPKAPARSKASKSSKTRGETSGQLVGSGHGRAA